MIMKKKKKNSERIPKKETRAENVHSHKNKRLMCSKSQKLNIMKMLRQCIEQANVIKNLHRASPHKKA
jgi:hypothetical protein